MHEPKDDDLDDLFGDEDDDDLFGDDEEVEDEFESEEPTQALVKVQAVKGTDDSEILSLNAEDIEFLMTVDDNSGRLHMTASVTNKSKLNIHLKDIRLILRDDEGHLLDYVDHYFDAKFTESQKLICEFNMGPDVVTRFKSIEVTAEFESSFKARLANGKCAPVEPKKKYAHRRFWPIEWETIDPEVGRPKFEIEMAGYTGYNWDTICEFILTLCEPSTAKTRIEDLVVVLRDDSGKVVTRENAWFSEPDACPQTKKIEFDIDRAKLRRIRSVDIAARGSFTRQDRLGEFTRL